MKTATDVNNRISLDPDSSLISLSFNKLTIYKNNNIITFNINEEYYRWCIEDPIVLSSNVGVYFTSNTNNRLHTSIVPAGKYKQ